MTSERSERYEATSTRGALRRGAMIAGLVILAGASACKKDETTGVGSTTTTTGTETSTTTTTTGAGGDVGTGGAGGGGGGAVGGGGGASGCVDDGACDLPAESCDCSDCLTEVLCGAGCEEFTLVDIQPGTGFFDGLISQVAGAGQDSLQGTGFSSIAPGLHALVEPVTFADCNDAPCLLVAADGGDTFSQAVSGTLDVQSASPLVLTIEDALFFPRTVDANGDFVIDKAGSCLFLKAGAIPTQ